MAAGATYYPIATTTLSSATNSVSFSSISGSYTDIVIVFNGAASTSGVTCNVQFNSDTGTNYSTTQQDLSLVRDMGTSILGGGAAAANVGIYPDGPDIITVMAQNIGSSSANI